MTAINAATGVTSRAVTDEEGIYRLLYLAPASYNLTYRKAGFSTLQRTEIMLRSNDTLIARRAACRRQHRGAD